MELTKEQIQFIDHRLENDGVKYWDIRIEMLDHIVTDVESILKPKNTECQFKEIVQEAFVSMGWKENFNGSSFEKQNKEGWKNVGKKYRKEYFLEVRNFFKKPKNLIVFILSLLLLFVLSQNVSNSAFLKINFIIFLLPALLFLWEYIMIHKKKLGNSIHKNYGLHYMSFSFLILNVFFQFMGNNDFLPIPTTYHKTIIFTIVPLHLVLSISGFQVYKKAIKRVETMRNNLLS